MTLETYYIYNLQIFTEKPSVRDSESIITLKCYSLFSAQEFLRMLKNERNRALF